jgi:hypothetical protein
MLVYVLSFWASLVLVGMKSLQQLNVQHEKVWWIPPTTYCLAAFEIYLWSRASSANLLFWFSVATGAWMGSLGAIWVHKRLRHD